MSIDESGQVNRGVKPRSFIIVGVVYLGAALLTGGIILIPSAILWFIAQAICRQEIENARNGPARFRRILYYPTWGVEGSRPRRVTLCMTQLRSGWPWRSPSQGPAYLTMVRACIRC